MLWCMVHTIYIKKKKDKEFASCALRETGDQIE
jgi:hypothetical protein